MIERWPWRHTELTDRVPENLLPPHLCLRCGVRVYTAEDVLIHEDFHDQVVTR